MLAALAALPMAARAPGRILYRDDFRHGLMQWRIEAAGDAKVAAREGVLDIDTPAGLTLWFLPALNGPIAIDYEVRAVDAGGPHDAVSDVNAFWMASDANAPDGSVLATRRSGVFEDYDPLRTYYVGIGGNRNTTTRMRRYVGKAGERPLLPEHDRLARADMLEPNRWFRLRLIADGQRIAVVRDGATLFSMTDGAPYRRGHFGVRTTQSHIQIRNFSISRL
ncbi:MAG TPA: Tat pathway signal sequence domain protein [Sphingobium sp.]|jgi:hypothetical protein|uniref:DUF6250 domain-containing protein n=1 Tax=Sphingobium sp. TaxID=1912891 RepID=UPI000EB854CC|nr:DUF6250 domain-containing protein [Sphingobium sp.]HAF43268.1 Tat pathway signal sequence domain protein [Sphingobium sp.]